MGAFELEFVTGVNAVMDLADNAGEARVSLDRMNDPPSDFGDERASKVVKRIVGITSIRSCSCSLFKITPILKHSNLLESILQETTKLFVVKREYREEKVSLSLIKCS